MFQACLELRTADLESFRHSSQQGYGRRYFHCGLQQRMTRDRADDLLRDERVTGALGDDAACYLRVLLTDARRCNLPDEASGPGEGSR